MSLRDAYSPFKENTCSSKTSWHKYGDRWLLRGTAKNLIPGNPIEVKLRDGTIQTVIVGEHVADYPCQLANELGHVSLGHLLLCEGKQLK